MLTLTFELKELQHRRIQLDSGGLLVISRGRSREFATVLSQQMKLSRRRSG